MKPCFEANIDIKPRTEWACHLKAFINSGKLAPPARDNSFTASSRTFEAFLGLGCFRPDLAFFRAGLGFRATWGLLGLSAAQIRVTATSRDSNFLTGFTPGSPL